MSIKLKVNALSGGSDSDVEVSDSAFGAEFNEALIHQVITAYMAGARSGTRAQKSRSDVSGGGAKPWRQKGTGRARAGTSRSPIWVGGGRAFPASTQDYSQKVNRKMYRAAMRSILSELNRQERLVVVDGFSMEAPKTKELATSLDKIDAPDALIILGEENSNVELSARNMKAVDVLNSQQVNPLDLVRFEKVVLTQDAARNIDAALQ